MTKIDEFINNITPSNYFITKSMEMSKISNSGTLWYTKKYIVLYDAIFISKKIDTQEGINEIIRNFNNYISTLPESVKEDAESFFFQKHADLRGDFRTYNEFAGVVDINTDKNLYYSNVNKYYFIYLMNIGGQSGVKAFIKEQLYKPDFVVSKLPEIIKEFQKNNPHKEVDITGTINDFHASLRNERQILFYYGYFHSRNNGAGNDNEFSSLTPIGEIAVKANSREFSMIWEHQKIKMISQPVTVDFPSIKKCNKCFSDKFQINYSPYFSILRCLEKHKKIFPRFYDRILSRSNNDNIDCIIEYYDEFVDSIPKIEAYLNSFNLRTENKNEDFEKEIKKYMLGIRTDFSKDNGENYLGLVSSTKNNGWIMDNQEKFSTLFDIYELIEKYKLNKYNSLFNRCEDELRKKYESVYTGNVYKKNHRVKMEWDLYNIKIEKTIIFSLLICEYLIFNKADIGSIRVEQVYDYFNEFFINILKSINLTKKKEIIKEINRIVEMIKVRELVAIDEIEENSIDLNYINQFSSLNTEDLRRKIIEVSMENIKPTLERKRDMRVISLLKKLQLIEYSDENSLIPCECCGQKTFIKNNNEPYMEYHHLIPFSIVNGPDHFENILGICPMCHRKIHFINDSLKESLYIGFNQNNHRKKNIADRLKELYKLSVLKSYQLEYALSEQMITEAEYEKIVA